MEIDEHTKAKIADQTKSLVAFLYNSDADARDGPTPLGTSFFVSMVCSELAGEQLEKEVTLNYLVTAKHVIEGLPEIWARVNLIEPHGGGNKLAVYRTVQADWVLSPSSDVALLLWRPDAELVRYRAFPLAGFATMDLLETYDIAEGTQVFFTGLFLNQRGTRQNTPITRHGHIALLCEEEIDLPGGPQKAYLVEAQVFPGNSGAPVMTRQTHIDGSGVIEVRLLGIMVASYNELHPVQGASAELFTVENQGIAVVVPCDEILKVHELPEMTKRHQQGLEDLRERHAIPKA